jgi:hypothetical protein
VFAGGGAIVTINVVVFTLRSISWFSRLELQIGAFADSEAGPVASASASMQLITFHACQYVSGR